ncbi:MAG: IclR family acetate operon transcriptional repressor [Sulfitobacter sp.]|jgi:IclR family acetate operon transcriptional repressor
MFIIGNIFQNDMVTPNQRPDPTPMNDKVPQKRPRGRPRSAFTDTSGNTVQALDRGLQVLGALARLEQATLSDLALAVGMPASTLHRILATLEGHDFVELETETQAWRIGIGAFRVGSMFLTRTNVVEAARAPMRRLMEDTGETANLGLTDGDEVVFIAQVESHAPIRAFFRPGSRGPMHCSGIGKALMAAMPRDQVERALGRTGLAPFTSTTLETPDRLFADLADTAARGWSFDDQERYEGMSCIAAVIRDSFGAAVAGVSVSGPAARFTPDRQSAIGTRVSQAADEISQAIGGAR